MSLSKHILFKLASRERPDKLIAAIENIKNFVADKENYSILVSVDEDDPSISKMFPSMQSIVDFKVKYSNVYLHFGFSKNKIDAINRDVNKHNIFWHILVNFSDDMEWTVQGFDNVIRDAFEKHGYNNFLHVHDQHPYNHEIASMSIMGREYYEKFGYIYNPIYKSFYCDNEALDVAKLLNEYIDLGGNNQLFKHNHPIWSRMEKDALYVKNDKYYQQDKTTYLKRKLSNFKN